MLVPANKYNIILNKLLCAKGDISIFLNPATKYLIIFFNPLSFRKLSAFTGKAKLDLFLLYFKSDKEELQIMEY